MYREISPNKLKELRGMRTQGQVADATGGKISAQEIGQYELGRYKPSVHKLPYLLKALNATWEQISEPVELETV